MEITIDTSALLAVCTNERSKPKLIEITAGCSLIAPASIHWEVGNALSAMLKRERIDLAQAQACVGAYREIPVKFVDVDLSHALALAARFRMYAYDAYLLSCAVQSRSPLLSLDSALNAAASQMGIQILGEF
jgi:predicted nucleic acid-binding protein